MTGTRRPQGDGSIYKLDDGRWRGSVHLGWHGGRRRRRYITRATRADVVRELRLLTQQAAKGRLGPSKSPRLDVWLDTWLEEVAAARVRPSTLHRYRQEVRLHIAPGLGHIRLDKLQPQDISSFYRDRLQVLSVGSVRRLHAVLRRSLTVAVRWGHLNQNPCFLIEAPPLVHHEVEPLSAEEVQQLFEAAAHGPMAARWTVAVGLGLRQGEALGLHWKDIDLEKNTLRVTGALQRQPDGSLTIVQPKTPRSRRTLPLPGLVVRSLKSHRGLQAGQRMLAGADWQDLDLVFTTRTGGPVHPRNDYRSYQALLKRGGIRRFRLHDLRHTTASLLLSQGVSHRVVMEILGHSQISVTMNIYSHVSPELSRAAADSMDTALSRPDEGTA